MKGYLTRTIVYMFAGVLLTALLWVINSGQLLEEATELKDSVFVLETAINPLDGNTQISSEQSALILYSVADEISSKLKKNLEETCRWMKIAVTALDVKYCDTVSYADYDMVIIATPYVESELGVEVGRILRYVENGGRLFWAMLPNELGPAFESGYRKLGIIDIGAYTEINDYVFVDELIPGSKGIKLFSDAFTDAAVTFQLEDKCRIYVETEQERIPLVWSYDTGLGRSVFCNFTALSGDYYTGMQAGCILALYDTFLYPVINAKTVFIDDFPSLQYNSESTVIKDEYNRTVKEFYRDIWWPDMQATAQKYNLCYTGVFMATYNDIVNPKDFEYSIDAMEQYYGNSLMQNGFEMGAHGYNHQSLTLAGGTPEEMKYKPWNSLRDMCASLEKYLEITEELFGDVKMYTYVPPSNYLSMEGRMAVTETLTDLKIISGVYTNEGETGDVYVQKFSMASDGVAEYPRVTAGMLESDYEDFAMMSAAGLYGTFSHFIHPDDILNEERGQGQTWQTLLKTFGKKLEMINERYSGLRALTAAEAADALKIAYYASVDYQMNGQQMECKIYNYYGEGYFYMKSERVPEAASAGVSIVRLNNTDEDYYLVHATQPEFVIRFK